MIKRVQILFIFVLVIVSFRFFDASFINEQFVNYFVFLFVLSAILLSIPFFFIRPEGFVLPIQLIVLSMLVSVFIAYISWGQGFIYSIMGIVPMLLWIFFFYLFHYKISVNVIEKIILIYGVVFIVLYFYQRANSQTIIFGKWGKEFLEERGVTRVIIAGGGIFFLSIFMAINKLTSQKSGKLFWIVLSIFGVIVPILQATRQYIAGVLIIYLYHFTKGLSLFSKAIAIAFIIGFLFYIANSNNTIVKGLINAQKETSQEGKEYIRVLSGTYFLTEFSPHNINKIIGNGLPFGGNSPYNKFVESLKLEGFDMSDVGIIGLYAMFGIIAVIGYILIWTKSFYLPLPKNYYYLKYYLWFLLITSLTSDNLYSYDYLISTVFVLYLYHSLIISHTKQDKTGQYYNELPLNKHARYQRRIIF